MPTPEPDRPDWGAPPGGPLPPLRPLDGIRARLITAEEERDEARARVAELENAQTQLLDRLDQIRGDLDTASTPESATEQPSAQVGTAANGANQPAVTDAMVQAAINGALDLQFESFPGPEGQETHRAHDAHGRTSGGYHGLCPLCRVTGAPESVSGPARLRVFRAALEAALASTPAETTSPA